MTDLLNPDTRTWKDFDPVLQEDLTVEDINGLLLDPEVSLADRNLLLTHRLTIAGGSAIASARPALSCKTPACSKPKPLGYDSRTDTDGSGD